MLETCLDALLPEELKTRKTWEKLWLVLSISIALVLFGIFLAGGNGWWGLAGLAVGGSFAAYEDFMEKHFAVKA